MVWTSKDGHKCPVSPADRGEFMKPSSVSTSATALLSCPFCGGDPILDLHYEDLSVNEETDADLEFVVIRCSSCGYSKERSSRHDLIDWWNTRSAPSSVSTPAQDATSLDNLHAYILHNYGSAAANPKVQEAFEAGLSRKFAALRATSQTPDAEHQRCIDMLSDIPGSTLEQKLTHYIGSYMALQIAASSIPSASAGPQAEAVTEGAKEDLTGPNYVGAALALGFVLLPTGNWYHPNDDVHFPRRFKTAKEIFEKWGPALSTPSASAGPQAEADARTIFERCAKLAEIFGIGRERASYGGSDIAVRIRADAVDYLAAHPQPQQAVAWQYRTHFEGSEQWTGWVYCDADQHERIQRTGKFGMYRAESRPLYAQPQPQQADGRGAVPKVSILEDELLIEWSSPWLVISITDDGEFGCAVRHGDGFEPISFKDAIRTLQQSPATDGPAK